MSIDGDLSITLMSLLAGVEKALAAGDCQAADQEMDAAAALCADLQRRGVALPFAELPALRALAERCGTALLHARDQLNAESRRDDNHRRALETYGQNR